MLRVGSTVVTASEAKLTVALLQTAYFTLSQRVTAYRKPIGGVEGGEGLDYPPPPGVTNHVEGSTHPSTKPGLPTQPAPVAAADADASALAPVTRPCGDEDTNSYPWSIPPRGVSWRFPSPPFAKRAPRRPSRVQPDGPSPLTERASSIRWFWGEFLPNLMHAGP